MVGEELAAPAFLLFQLGSGQGLVDAHHGESRSLGFGGEVQRSVLGGGAHAHAHVREPGGQRGVQRCLAQTLLSHLLVGLVEGNLLRFVRAGLVIGFTLVGDAVRIEVGAGATGNVDHVFDAIAIAVQELRVLGGILRHLHGRSVFLLVLGSGGGEVLLSAFIRRIIGGSRLALIGRGSVLHRHLVLEAHVVEAVVVAARLDIGIEALGSREALQERRGVKGLIEAGVGHQTAEALFGEVFLLLEQGLSVEPIEQFIIRGQGGARLVEILGTLDLRVLECVLGMLLVPEHFHLI